MMKKVKAALLAAAALMVLPGLSSCINVKDLVQDVLIGVIFD
jgi:hypothetical protein